MRSTVGTVGLLSMRAISGGWLDERLRQLWITIRDKVLEYANQIIEAIKKKLDSIKEQVNTMRENPSQAVMDNIGPIMRKIVDALTSRFLAAAAPFIGAGLYDLLKGGLKLGESSCPRGPRPWCR